MRILVVPRDFPSDEQPHAGIFVLRQILALRELGHHAEVLRLVPSAPPLFRKWRTYRRIPASYNREGVAVRSVRALVPPRLLGIGFVRMQFAAPLLRAIERFRPDIVHAHCTLPTAALCIGIDTPLVVTAHGSDTYVEPWRRADLEAAARAGLRNATSVVAVSAFVQGAVRELGRDDAAVVFNGADERVFCPKSRLLSRKVMNIDSRRKVILFAGNLLRSKGIFELAGALGQMRGLRPLLLVAGVGPEAAALRALLGELDVEHSMMGLIPQGALATALDAADAFAFPSHAEGLPTVVCEAMLAGRAVVATPVGGIPEIIRHGETGLLAAPGDVTRLAAELRRVLTDDALRVGLESRARDFGLAHLTWRRNARAYDAVYRQTIDRYFAAHKSS